MTKNANFSPRPATKGCCTVAEDKSLRLCFSVPPPSSSCSSFLLARSFSFALSLSRIFSGCSSAAGIESNSLLTWALRSLPLGSHLHYGSGRIYWPQNTMRTCPCPSTETGSRPLVVYLFAVAIHIRPLRHVAAQKRRREEEETEGKRTRPDSLGVFYAWSSKFCASAAREVAKQMATMTILKRRAPETPSED